MTKGDPAFKCVYFGSVQRCHPSLKPFNGFPLLLNKAKVPKALQGLDPYLHVWLYLIGPFPWGRIQPSGLLCAPPDPMELFSHPQHSYLLFTLPGILCSLLFALLGPSYCVRPNSTSQERSFLSTRFTITVSPSPCRPVFHSFKHLFLHLLIAPLSASSSSGSSSEPSRHSIKKKNYETKKLTKVVNGLTNM